MNLNLAEDPWHQHAFWSPNCDFVLKRKGKEFVDEALKYGHILNCR